MYQCLEDLQSDTLQPVLQVSSWKLTADSLSMVSNVSQQLPCELSAKRPETKMFSL